MVSPPPQIGPQPGIATPRTANAPERGSPSPSGAVAALDRADIRPLDVPAALQILLAEVRAAFELLLIEASRSTGVTDVDDAGDTAPATLDGPLPAARVLVETVLRSLPDPLDINDWSAALPRAEAALQTGVQRAVDVISAWRDVAPVVVETTKESVQLALNVLGDQPQNPLWLRPEWLAMAPRLARFWRRRRACRRRLTDPDYDATSRWDEIDDRPQ